MRGKLGWIVVLLIVAAGVLTWQLGWLGSSKPKYNVVLISIDSLRPDRLGAYGHRPDYVQDLAVSPNIDAIALEGVTFDNAWSTTSWTLPAHMAMMTGLTDGSHNVIQDDFRLDPLRSIMAEKFRAAGYKTGGFYSGPYLDPKYGFGRGFDIYESGMIPMDDWVREVVRWKEAREARGEKVSPAMVTGMRDRKSHIDITSPRINQKGLKFLEEHAGEDPFFLFLHYFDVHYDHLPENCEPGLDKKFDPEYAGLMDGVNWYFNPKVVDQESGRQLISERDLGHVQALYDAEIFWVDRHIGRIVQSLKDLGVYDNTIICITSDHGDEFFEHDRIGHRGTLWTEVLKIALILRIPDGLTAPGKRLDTVARIYDIAPTLLDYAGVDSISEAEGSSLRPEISGESGPKRAALGRIMAPGNRPGGFPPMQDCWRNENYTVIRHLRVNNQRTQAMRQLVLEPIRARHSIFSNKSLPFLVYDRREDPEESKPLARTDSRYLEAIQQYTEDFTQAQDSRLKLKRSGLSERLAPKFDAETEASLKAIGYASVTIDNGGPQQRFPTPAPLPIPKQQ